jgi:bifunctional DNA-binding transcriptional regulator/antitoxin component of YhaV-PrlF toxin-antitoxin module
MNTCKIQKTGIGVHQITIPESIRRDLGWEKGNTIGFEVKGKTLNLKRMVKEE